MDIGINNVKLIAPVYEMIFLVAMTWNEDCTSRW